MGIVVRVGCEMSVPVSAEALKDFGDVRRLDGLGDVVVASDPTAWRLLSRLDEPMLADLRAARA